MSTAQVRLVKAVDRPPKTATLPLMADEHDFWMQMRHALLQQLATIEKKLGISRRCRHCGEDL
jgi:hypothetical protein